jgi:hypothetical protein
MKWYYVNNNEAKGPFSLEEILPNIEPDTQVWREESLPEWIEASKHPLLQILFNSPNQNSNEEDLSAQMQTEELNIESKKPTTYEINIALNSDWKTKGIGSRGDSYLYVDNNFVQKVSLDSFNVKVKTQKEKPLIQFVSEGCFNNGMDEDSVEFWLEEFPNDIIEISLPNFDCTKNYRIDIEYGDRKPSFFGGDMGILPKPKNIQPY